jgi:hypothetical protein
MVVTPSTNTASADFCLQKRQASPDRVRYLSSDPGCVYIGLLSPFSDFTVCCQLTPLSMPLYAVFVHPVQILLSGFLSTKVLTFALAFG